MIFVVLFVVHCGRTVIAIGATYVTQTNRQRTLNQTLEVTQDTLVSTLVRSVLDKGLLCTHSHPGSCAEEEPACDSFGHLL